MADVFDPDAAAPYGSGVFGLPHSAEQAGVILIPVPWDATTSYRDGAALGPAAIRSASHQVDLFDVETGRPYLVGIHMLDEEAAVSRLAHHARDQARPVIDAGGPGDDEDLVQAVADVNDRGVELNAWLRRETERWLDRRKLVGIVGGDHSVPFGAIEAVAARHPGMGILHVDAHADLRQAYEGFTWSHASIMYNVATQIPGVAKIVQVGVRDVGAAEDAFIAASAGRIVTHYAPNLAALRFGGETWGDQCARIIAELPREVWISFDIDGLDPAYCPHTGTPVPGGLSFAEAAYLLRVLGESGRRIVGFDLSEVAPARLGSDERTGEQDEWDGNVGARVLYKMIGWAVRKA
jgi:agmatinase